MRLCSSILAAPASVAALLSGPGLAPVVAELLHGERPEAWRLLLVGVMRAKLHAHMKVGRSGAGHMELWRRHAIG